MWLPGSHSATRVTAAVGASRGGPLAVGQLGEPTSSSPLTCDYDPGEGANRIELALSHASRLFGVMNDETLNPAAVSNSTTAGALNALSPLAAKPVEEQAAEDIITLFLRKPLYAKLEGNEEYLEALGEVIRGKAGVEFDNYCVTCDQITPWTLRQFVPRNSGGGVGTGGSLANRYIQAPVPVIRAVNIVCLRRQHFYTYILHVSDTAFQKVGQKPSMADIAFGELKAIPGVDKQDRKELGRALGLFAHDTPLGAFVYLRRVFERMIERAHERHFQKQGSHLEKWLDWRMGERIEALADELPAVVRSNSSVWGLLSKGIHELSDEEAEVLFPLVKAVIFEMLGEEERDRQAAIQSEATRKALADATARFNLPRPK